jgi:4-hydroxy-4-methyl-2-oxoglutarate aldolase
MIDRLSKLGTALVSDVLDEAGFHNQTLDPSLGFIGPAKATCGPAICVQGGRYVTTRTDGSTVGLQLYSLPVLAQRGSIMVLATGGFRGGGVTGELLAADLAEAGVVGLVTDGLIRDREAIAESAMPVIAAGSIPLNGARRFSVHDHGVPVILPGPEGAQVRVSPGDMVLADADGVVVIPQSAAPQVLEMAETLASKEHGLKTAPAQTAEERAEARAGRMSHMVWLRQTEGTK